MSPQCKVGKQPYKRQDSRLKVSENRTNLSGPRLHLPLTRLPEFLGPLLGFPILTYGNGDGAWRPSMLTRR